MIKISSRVAIPEREIEITAITAQGPGGQNVNKSATAIHLRFDSQNSSLPQFYKDRLLQLRDRRITAKGLIVIKSQRFRSQEQNREDALERLQELIVKAGTTPKQRIATKPSRSSKVRRLDTKKKLGQVKQLRGRIQPDG